MNINLKNTQRINLDVIIKDISNNYSPLNDACKEELTNACKLVTLEKFSLLVKEGQLACNVYYIYKGCARAYYLKNGKEITDWFAFEGDFVSSIDSFFRDVPCMYNIELVEQTTFLEISKESVFFLSDKYHCFEKLGRIAVTKTMLHLQQRIVSMQFETAFQKYENLLIMRPDITQRVPLTHIASYLGITLETLSRIRNPQNRI